MQQETTGKDPTNDTQRKALTFDPNEYRKYVAEACLTPAQEAELLETIWAIMVGFVDLGFGLHPIQQANADVHKRRGALEADSARMVSYAHAFKEIVDNEQAAAPEKGSPATRTDS